MFVHLSDNFICQQLNVLSTFQFWPNCEEKKVKVSYCIGYLTRNVVLMCLTYFESDILFQAFVSCDII